MRVMWPAGAGEADAGHERGGAGTLQVGAGCMGHWSAMHTSLTGTWPLRTLPRSCLHDFNSLLST